MTDSQAPPAVIARDFGWTYASRPRPALAGLTFRLEPGQMLLVLGPSGSGKSTLGRALAGLVPHELPGEMRGSLSVDDLEVGSLRREMLGQAVGIVFQEPETQLVMPRVEDEVAFGLENRGWERPDMLARVAQVLADVGLAGFERRSSSALSGGEQQRLAIAGVLAPMPRLLVFDEPTANLDPPGTLGVLERLAGIVARRDRTVVVIEHRLDAVFPLADRVLLLDGQGRQLAFGSPDEVGPRFAGALARTGSWLPAAWQAWAANSSDAEAQAGVQDANRAGQARSQAALPAQSSSSGNADHPVLIASTVTVCYPRGANRDAPPALDSVNLELAPGERVGVVGPNGAGKSSLLFVLAGLRRPDRGAVRVGDGSRPPDEDPARLPGAALARRLGLVFQNPELGFLGRTVAEEVAASLPATGRAADAADPSVVDSLSAFGLDQLAKVNPYHLSEGEQRRLSIAAASLSGSRILLLDEPTFGLDRRGSAAVLAVLARLQANGQAQLVATHDPRLIGSCRRVVALDGGRVVFDGSSAGFLSAPPYAPPQPWMRALQP